MAVTKKKQEAVNNTPLEQAQTELDDKISKLRTTSNVIFKTEKGRAIVLVPPKFTYVDSTGSKTKCRYAPLENSIFEEEQHDEDISLEFIAIDNVLTVSDRKMLEYLVMYFGCGKTYHIDDPHAKAKAEMARVELFDNVWGKISGKSASELHALHMLVFQSTYSHVMSIDTPMCKMQLRNKTAEDPKEMEEFLADPLQKGVYLYGAGIALGEIVFDRRSNVVRWVRSKEEICVIPVGDIPSMHFAKEMMNPENAEVRASLEAKILGK